MFVRGLVRSLPFLPESVGSCLQSRTMQEVDEAQRSEKLLKVEQNRFRLRPQLLYFSGVGLKENIVDVSKQLISVSDGSSDVSDYGIGLQGAVKETHPSPPLIC